MRKALIVLLVLMAVGSLLFSACAAQTPVSKPETKAPEAAQAPAKAEPAASKPEAKAPEAAPAKAEKPASKPETKAPEAAPAPAKAQKLVMVQGTEPPHLNWPEGGNSSLQMPMASVLEALTRRDPKTSEILPLLATRWEQVEPKRWRFYLRQGVKFHNGEELTADDVVATVKWYVDLKGSLAGWLPMQEGVAKERYVVDIVTNSVDPQFPLRTPFLYINPKAIARDNPDLANTKAIGTGPYKLAEWRKGDRMIFTGFDGYWGKKPQIADVDLLFRGEEAVRVAMLRTGEAQWAFPIGPENAKKVPKLVRIPSTETWVLRLNASYGKDLPLADKRLRQAINYAIDRKALIDHLYEGLASPALGQRAIPAAFGWDPAMNDYPYDLEKAKTLVKEAGAVGKTITWIGSSGSFPKDREFNEAVARMVEQTGLKVNLRFPEFTEFLDYLFTRDEKTRGIMSDVVALTTGTETLDFAQGRVFLDKGGSVVGFEDPRIFGLWKDYDAATDVKIKLGKLQEVSRYAQDEALVAWVLKPDFAWGVAANLEWFPSPEGTPFVADMRVTQ